MIMRFLKMISLAPQGEVLDRRRRGHRTSEQGRANGEH
jgi:hypothetical protein